VVSKFQGGVLVQAFWGLHGKDRGQQSVTSLDVDFELAWRLHCVSQRSIEKRESQRQT